MWWPFKKRDVKPKRKKFYNAAQISRLTSSWTTTQSTTTEELKSSLRVIRARARDLGRNSDYVNRFFNLVQVNVVGSAGVGLQSKVVNSNDMSDDKANQKLESGWKEWGAKGICEITKTMTWLDCQKMVAVSFARDGEILIRKHRGKNINKFGFAIELIDPDRLDENFNKPLGNGREIRLGIEYDSIGVPVAYHIFKKHPATTVMPRERERVPADDIEHLFIVERVGQERGVPRLVTAMARLKMLDGYEEAELVAARTAAATMGILVNPDSDFAEDDDDDVTEVTFDAEPGTFKTAPDGFDMKMFDPNHPNSAFADFEKAILRGIASGLNVSYVSLANDLEGVSYSSIRQGELADRDNWRVLQSWLIQHFITPIWEAWLEEALFSRSINLPYPKYEKFNKPAWQPRGWAWVDPSKEISANKEAVKAGFKSVSDIITEQGKDPEEVFARLAKDKQLAEKYDINLDVLIEEAEGNVQQNA